MNAPSSLSVPMVLDRLDALISRIESWVPVTTGVAPPDWSASTAFRYRKRLQGRAVLEPVKHMANLSLDDVREVESQKERIVHNTRRFVQGLPANNVLLTGARGTGKSSLIKACLNAFSSQGLRLVEVDKADLVDLPDLMDVLAERPERFIVYCDDLSFDEGESGYKALKSVLDGSVSVGSANVLVYATSNRRHLLPETMKDNLQHTQSADGELHPGEAVEEKISLSERFGLWISFYPFSQDEYLTIAGQWLRALGASEDEVAAARPHALIWALERGSRSGRVAHQFARHHISGPKD